MSKIDKIAEIFNSFIATETHFFNKSLVYINFQIYQLGGI